MRKFLFRSLVAAALLTPFLGGCTPASPSTSTTLLPTPPASLPLAVPSPTVVKCETLIIAVMEQDDSLVRQCLQEGQDANQADGYGLSPLNYAAALGDVEVVESLLEAGADVNYQDPWGMTSLHAALKEGHDPVSRLLIDSGADVNKQTTAGNYVGFTPLHAAIYFGNTGTEIVEQILQKGALVDAEDAAGRTPLQLAREKGLKEIETLLITYGASEK